MTLRVATVNVNGVRAALRKGLDLWLEGCDAQVVCLQEVRAPLGVLGEAFPEWEVAEDVSEIRGRAGAAILSRLPLTDVVVGMPGLDLNATPTHTGRWVEATLGGSDPVTVVSVYVHSGEAGTPKMEDKKRFLDQMTERMRFLAEDGKKVVVVGDVNIAHTNRDIKNWRGNRTSAGFLPEERVYLDRWTELGWVDVHRALSGDVDGPYTWWVQWGTAFENDTGWRIDQQWATGSLAGFARRARVDKAPSPDRRFSDHAPLLVDYDVL